MSQNIDKNVLESWNLVRYHAKKLRSQYVNSDGLKFWQPIKKFTDSIKSDSDIEWSHQVRKDGVLFRALKPVFEIYPEYDKEGKLVETNHFLHQHFNIPNRDQPSFRKLMQISLNGGQLEGNFEEYNIHIKKAFKGAFQDIDTFMSTENINRIRIVDDDVVQLKKILDESFESAKGRPVQTGGYDDTYYSKYKKYKSKYIRKKLLKM